MPCQSSLVGSDRNSRAGNEKREVGAGSKISRPEREKAGNGTYTPKNWRIEVEWLISYYHPIVRYELS